MFDGDTPSSEICEYISREDCEFVAHARQDIPALLAEVERLRSLHAAPPQVEGSWPAKCLGRAFVDGARWQLWHDEQATMFASERNETEAEAQKRYGADTQLDLALHAAPEGARLRELAATEAKREHYRHNGPRVIREQWELTQRGHASYAVCPCCGCLRITEWCPPPCHTVSQRYADLNPWTGEHRGDFESCSHPDCLLVRSAPAPVVAEGALRALVAELESEADYAEDGVTLRRCAERIAALLPARPASVTET